MSVAAAALFAFRNERAHLRGRLAFEMQKSHHHIRHLHAGVVDVVLHIHFLPGGAQQAHKRVAQNGIAQMPDMRSLVGIDGGVLHQRMILRGRRAAFGAYHHLCCRAAIQPRVDVSRARNLKSRKSFNRAQGSHDLLGNYLGGFAQLACQFKRHRRGDFAKAEIGRRLQRQVLERKIVFFFQHRANGVAEPFLQFQNHA